MPTRRTPEEFAQDRKEHLTGRLIRVKDVGQRGAFYWRCEAATLRPEGQYPKVLVLERWRLERMEGEPLHPGTEQQGDVGYRFRYYTVARNGRWWWGQSALMVRAEELEPLLAKARAEGTLLT